DREGCAREQRERDRGGEGTAGAHRGGDRSGGEERERRQERKEVTRGRERHAGRRHGGQPDGEEEHGREPGLAGGPRQHERASAGSMRSAVCLVSSARPAVTPSSAASRT